MTLFLRIITGALALMSVFYLVFAFDDKRRYMAARLTFAVTLGILAAAVWVTAP